MTTIRLRPRHSDEELAAIYETPHDHRLWGHGHHLRVEQAKVFARWIAEWKQLDSVADLSCGNGAIAKATGIPYESIHLGDFAPGYRYAGPLEETVEQIPQVGLFVCSETIEHLDDPALALTKIRDKASYLVLTTPIGAWSDTNTEHYWAWDTKGVEELLSVTGWNPIMFASLNSTYIGEVYNYGLWVAQ